MGGSEAVSYMRELQFCLSSVCFLVLLKKILLVLQMWNLDSDIMMKVVMEICKDI